MLKCHGAEMSLVRMLCCAVSSTILPRLDDGAEVGSPPGPGAVVDDVDRVGVEWSVVCVELARLVRRTVVVRVTDW